MCIGRIRNERFFTCWSRSPLLIGLPFALALRGWLKLIARAFDVVIVIRRAFRASSDNGSVARTNRRMDLS
jgi:hypothetical protein